ncbi:MAG: c-type cytochrome [Fuerstiella sp.]|nr:c-type cytochrome [Fuerstiella sp.]MCP4857148.1 c-type cytochrome [Fuerstiella sp.]
MRSPLAMVLVCLHVLVVAGVAKADENVNEPGKLKLLIVDGQNNHDWKTVTPLLSESLNQTARFDVEVVTTPSGEAEWKAFAPEFSKYDVVLSNYYGREWSENVHAELERFVAGGGGFVAFHAAVASFPKREAYNRMIGMGWRDAEFGDRLAISLSGEVVRQPAGEGHGAGHGVRHEYALHTRAPQHAVMAGLPDTWMHMADELYHGMRGPAENVELLATAYSPVTRLNEPLLWTVRYGKGRVFVTVLGHDAVALKCVGFQTTLARGCEWAARGTVSMERPMNFPTVKHTRTGSPVVWSGIPRATIDAHIDPGVKVYGSHAAVKLPIEQGVLLHNPTAITAGPGGTIYAANYTGQIYRLEDTNGDGLEETAALFADISADGKQYPSDDAAQYPGTPQHGGLRYPTGMVFKGNDLYVATTQEIRIYRDTTGDGRADHSEIFAAGWPFTMHFFDWTFAPRFGPDGHLYAILCTDYLNAARKPDPFGLRGSIVRISPDGKKIERFANGLRYAYGLAFNPQGDMFFSDNKGGGNPTEELNHVVAGANYGHNPHSDRPPGIEPRSPILELHYGAGGGGIAFNDPGNDFGGTAGDLFAAMWGPDGQWEDGSITRVKLTRQDDGNYDATEHRFSTGPAKVIDLCFSPAGDLYVAQFGREGRAHVPFEKPEGAIYRFIHAPWVAPDHGATLADVNLLKLDLAGDPLAGKAVFKKRACVNCHSIDGSMKHLGPDLREVGSTLSLKAIVESLEEPNANIKTGFESYVILTVDGRVETGRLLKTEENTVTLVAPQENTTGRTIVLEREEIEEMKLLPTSLMPTGLTAGLSDVQKRDLLAYMQSLRSAERIVRLNVGGDQIKDESEAIWLADREYSEGGFGATGGKAFHVKTGQPLLDDCRFGEFAYRFDLDNGEYDVTLISAEPYFKSPGKRVFSASVEGQALAEEIDLFAQTGFGKAVQNTIRVKVEDGRLDIEFTPNINLPLVSGIEVRRVMSERE